MDRLVLLLPRKETMIGESKDAVLTDLGEAAKVVIEHAADHRQYAIDAGFSTEAAEAMAVSLHSVMLAKLLDEEEDEVIPPPPPSPYGRMKGDR